MSDDLLKIDRRGFLRGSALTAAALAVLPLGIHAQDQQPPAENKEKDKDKEKEKDKAEKAENKADKKDGDAEKDPFKETKLDDQGREYRMCPQCGYNMYRQDRTWTCENCGYSYVE